MGVFPVSGKCFGGRLLLWICFFRRLAIWHKFRSFSADPQRCDTIQTRMTTEHSRSRSWVGIFFAMILALLLGAAALVLFLRHATHGAMAQIADRITGRTTAFDTSVPAIVHRIQRLNRLETVVYSMDTVVEGSKSSAVLPDLLAGDRILLVVHGQAIAGIDLSKLKPEDIRITESNGTRKVHVNLPATQLFTTTVDNQHTRVYARTTGLLVPVDQNLESETRARAEKQLEQTALSDGILDAAHKNAQAAVTTLLYSLGFQQVDVS